MVDLNINLFEYLDYRLFLRDYYKKAKESKKGFSLRSFSKKAGFSSSNFFKLVMDGDRNLTSKSVIPFCKGLELNQLESKYFKSLVVFNQADSHAEQEEAYQVLLKIRAQRKLEPLALAQHEYFSKWYNPVVRELIAGLKTTQSIFRLKEKLIEDLSEKEIKESIELLESLEFIQENNGLFEQKEGLVTSGVECRSVTLLNYHIQILELVARLLERVPAQNRDVSALTLGIKKEQFPKIKKMIQDFRKEILNEVSGVKKSDDVILLSMQLVPLTKPSKGNN